MKNIIYLIILNFTLLACNSNKKETTTETIAQLSVQEQIAMAHGLENWDKVSKLEFTFNVDREGNHFERSWIWEPKTNQVTMMTAADTISYNRMAVDSLSLNADRAFINDKFWLLIPFQLVWDNNTNISKSEKVLAPIAKDSINKLTITYPSDGGYTPGDAYDIFYNDDFMIEEWIYRKGNSSEPSLVNSFENYITVNGIKFAQDHKQPDIDWNLNFTNIKIEN
ncbi:hypothetical protein FJ651_01815 [Paucihalobacter ruber]|uniref:Uncharacterized protein n=1 Tax=Paucihalobacter ruber TaxID=2567861 RepID=A0A506PPN8_9FLAO|nr:hypothetical protein [Paucihalobacter ruber]TPV35674.1 hypothetical protein FJ651_01815 [Paucihalobacter ruber]